MEIQKPSCTTTCTKSDEPLAPTATDELLAELIKGSEDALFLRLAPDLRFVVQHWPDLPEDTKRAILAIVRGTQVKVGDENVLGLRRQFKESGALS